MDDEIELADLECPKCGNEMVTRPCIAGCEDGYENRYEEDPLWYDENKWFRCDECRGHGHHVWCQKCGWDHLENRYLNGAPKLEPSVSTEAPDSPSDEAERLRGGNL